MENRISVAMATYNGGKFLKEQLDSIYSQSVLPYEVVVSDDCSEDNTVEILEEYKQQFGLKYITNDHNVGVNKNFERAILACTGDYVALSDQDDVWMPNKIETCYKKLIKIENLCPALVTSECISTDEFLNIIEKKKCKDNKDSDSYISMLLGPPPQGCTMMMTRSLIKYIIPLPTDANVMFDSYISLTAAMVGNTSSISKSLMYYRHHSNNVCGRISSKPVIFEIIKEKLKDKYPNFISNKRLNNLREVELVNSANFISNRRSLFYKLLELNNKDISHLESLKIIWNIKEINIQRKLTTSIFKLSSVIFHCIFKKYL